MAAEIRSIVLGACRDLAGLYSKERLAALKERRLSKAAALKSETHARRAAAHERRMEELKERMREQRLSVIANVLGDRLRRGRDLPCPTPTKFPEVGGGARGALASQKSDEKP